MSKFPMKSKAPDANHKAAYQAIMAALRPYAVNMTAEEVLALFANIVGKTMALQDQRKYTSAMVMEIVIENLKAGNAEAIAGLDNPEGNA